jgi:tRNA 2-thiouridine synthesizing protein A
MPELKPDIELDVMGLVCPQPMLRTMKTLKDMRRGQVLLVKASDRSTRDNIPALCRRIKAKLLETQESGSVYKFWIKKV